MTRPLFLILSAATMVHALSGCGDEDLGCAVIADPDNCWAAAALTLAECLPEGGAGTLAADRASCTFSDGSEVVFDSPLPESSWDLEELAFTVERDGETCARFVDTFGNRMELTAGGGTVVAELHPNREFHVHCPGGPTYSSSFDRLFDCAGEGAPPPTDGFTVEQDLVEFMISSINTPGMIFTCTPAL